MRHIVSGCIGIIQTVNSQQSTVNNHLTVPPELISVLSLTQNSELPQKTPALALRGVLKANYIFLPFFVHTTLNVFSHFKIKTAVRLPRRMAERHSRFFWRAAAFIDIAAHAGGDEVFPSVASSARSGNHVIQRQIVPGITAVLTRVRVPVQDVPARKRNILIGNSDVMP